MSTKKIGLALSGGAARGLAHIGVMKVLRDEGIPVDIIGGTSAGSIVGGAYAAGLTLEEIEEMGRNVGWFSVSRPSLSPRGILSNAPLGSLIRSRFPAVKFEDLIIPYVAVACDLATGDEIVFHTEGSIIDPIRASCAVPGVFAPVTDHLGRLLVDGGVVAPVPTQAVRDLGADIVIAVDVLASGSTRWSVPKTFLGVIFQCGMMQIRASSELHGHNADICIVPEIAHIRIDDLSKIDELISLGEAAAREKISDIKALIA